MCFVIQMVDEFIFDLLQLKLHATSNSNLLKNYRNEECL